jgi:hypothetical protein
MAYYVTQSGMHYDRNDCPLGRVTLFASTTRDGIECWTAQRALADTFDTPESASLEALRRIERGDHLRDYEMKAQSLA